MIVPSWSVLKLKIEHMSSMEKKTNQNILVIGSFTQTEVMALVYRKEEVEHHQI